MTATAAQAEKLEFKTELKQLLHLITHSLYSNKEIFLRELISNATDAINKIKFDSLQHEELLEDNKDWKIKISLDKEAGTLTVSDNGVGMSLAEAVENLGTIAKSGTRAFLDNLKKAEAKDRPDLIGQFGVGFYSAFMVADKVTVVSRPAATPSQPSPSEGEGRVGVKWESDGQGEFTVEPVRKEKRGTDVTLHLKADEKEFLDEWRVRQIVRKFSDFIEHPVVMDVPQGELGSAQTKEETLNSRKAIWLRTPTLPSPRGGEGGEGVTEDEYAEFYKTISGDPDKPAKVIHYVAEGANEFRVLLFIPGHRPFTFDWGEVKVGPRLYIQRVLIMDHCEDLLPPYLRFVSGVVDSSDLPLNISRELLQHNPLLATIRKNLIKAVLKALDEMKTDEYEKYVQFFKGLGAILKEGVGRDHANREKVADLLLFESMNTEKGKYTTLPDYVARMGGTQNDIYYLIGEDREQLEHSPYLEAFRARGWDVLVLTDPVDEFMAGSLHKYKEEELKAADRGELDADKGSTKSETAEQYKALFDTLKAKLPEVADVRLSSRLKESAACLVADEHGMTAHLERLMQRMGRFDGLGPTKRVLELNGDHPAIQALRKLHEQDANDPRVESYARLLYDQAVIAEGSKVKDPLAFARRINELLVKGAG
jgi:molecular chaperone HtpG